MYYKDLGYSYIEQGLDKNDFGEKISHYFYGVSFDHISFISDGLFSTMVNTRANGEIYAASFDFSAEILEQILSLVSSLDKAHIERMVAGKRAGSVDLERPISIKNIQAKVGNVERNAKEIYAPFVIESIEI